MDIKKILDNPEEIFIGSMLQFPLFFIIGWPVFAIMCVSGVLWRLGGVEGGSKYFRRLGVPFLVCGISFFYGAGWNIFLAIPFMVWLAPSYGKESWLYKLIKKDLPVRLICFFWYWAAFDIAFMLK